MGRAAGSGTRVDAAILAACVVLVLVLKAASVSVREGLASALRVSVLAPLISLQSSAEKWRTALESHDAIIAARDSAILLAMQAAELRAENERLARMHLLGSRLRWGFIPAQALQTPTLGGMQTVTLTAGARQGVQRLSPVIAPDGLVGFVQSVDENTSVANLWTNEKFAVSAMSEDGQAYGVVKPHLGAGADRQLLELRYVPYRHKLKPGTRIVATGHGGVFPALVPIGTIVDSLNASGDWARAYLVRPAVKPQDIGFVMILSPDRAAAGTQGVWENPAARDSAVRLIVSRGDSIARTQYQKELKAATDSALARMRIQGLPADSAPARAPAGRSGGSGGGG